MLAQWTGELVGRMHNARITAKQLAEKMGKNPKYVSQVLNGHYIPKTAGGEWDEDSELTVPVTHWMPLPEPPKETDNG